MSKLSLESLAVETFWTEDAGALAAPLRTRDSQCGSCGTACTMFHCGPLTANYTDCGSCGIACTVIGCEPVSANYTDCGSCGIACTSIEC